ncbi:hypothetical protein LTR94_024904 [Friedmanniomyces endolithicus]|nr:hypothetical protein LTR94_024904 [Friedmanniomyces endolithicus]
MVVSACASTDGAGPPSSRSKAAQASEPGALAPASLGGMDNSVKADMPTGQRAYLARLRCANGRAPSFSRLGSYGIVHSSHVIDGYQTLCPGSTPEKTLILIDMYHPGHVEAKPVEGFTLAPS